jgi:hypothetical protein
MKENPKVVQNHTSWEKRALTSDFVPPIGWSTRKVNTPHAKTRNAGQLLERHAARRENSSVGAERYEPFIASPRFLG